jgi:rod shape-determining protein MreC
MAIIANRIKTKNYLVELTKFILFLLRRFCIVILICACSYLLYFPIQIVSRSSLELYGILISAGSLVSDSLIENVKILYNRLSYFKNLEAENIKLKLQLAKISDLETATTNALAENIELRKLLKVTDNVQAAYITSRLLGVNITPLSSSAIIEAGDNNNVKINDLVTSQDGLIGKVINVSYNYSSIMLLNDPSSRVPVVTSSSRERGILAKQGDNMLLIYLPEEHQAQVGELIYTSGDGKVYPYGLLVGKVDKVNNDGVFVKLSTDLNKIEFVNIESRPQEN